MGMGTPSNLTRSGLGGRADQGCVILLRCCETLNPKPQILNPGPKPQILNPGPKPYVGGSLGPHVIIFGWAGGPQHRRSQKRCKENCGKGPGRDPPGNIGALRSRIGFFGYIILY